MSRIIDLRIKVAANPTMRRTSEELEKAARDAEAWLDSLDPTTTPAERIERKLKKS